MSSETSTDGFHVSHFFVLLSLLAATVAVVLARPSAPENLILISLTIGAAGAAGFGVYLMLAPLVVARAARLGPGREVLSDRMRSDLEREKALTLRSIKELEFDRAMGKLSTQDFDEMSGRLRARALGIMKQLDAGSAAYRALIEKELAARLGNKLAAPSQPDVCACGTKNDADAKFCKSCGAKLRAA
jgi:zinc ribbon protein